MAKKYITNPPIELTKKLPKPTAKPKKSKAEKEKKGK